MEDKQAAAQSNLYPTATTGDSYPPPYATFQNAPSVGVAYSQGQPQQYAYSHPYPPVTSPQPYGQAGYPSAPYGPPGFEQPPSCPGYYSPPQQVVIMSGAPQPVFVTQPNFVSMIGAIVLSCFVFWCCGLICGSIAFILALVGQSTASSGNTKGAIQLRNASYGVSIAGIVFGVIITILYFVLLR